jgi:membrane protein
LAVQQMLESAKRPADSGPAAVFGIGLPFVAATSVFVELRDSLNRIWRVPQRPGNSGLWVLVQARLMPFGRILGVGFLLVVSLAVSAAP